MKKVNLSTEDVGRKRKAKEHPRIQGNPKLLPRFRWRRYKHVTANRPRPPQAPPGIAPQIMVGDAVFHFNCLTNNGEPIYKHIGSNNQVRYRIFVGS